MPEFITTDLWSCQLSPFPEPPPVLEGSIDPLPPPVETPTSPLTMKKKVPGMPVPGRVVSTVWSA